jgi:hypothetical protein
VVRVEGDVGDGGSLDADQREWAPARCQRMWCGMGGRPCVEVIGCGVVWVGVGVLEVASVERRVLDKWVFTYGSLRVGGHVGNCVGGVARRRDEEPGLSRQRHVLA